MNFSSYINAMEQAGVMRTLAEPSLTAISGKEAKFYVGGEYRLASEQNISEEEDKLGNTRPVLERGTDTVEYR